jgi:hypothetical protein
MPAPLEWSSSRRNQQAVVLDATGRELARWNRDWPIRGQRPTDRRVVVAHTQSSSGTWRLDGFHHQRSQCIDLRAPAGVKVAGDFPTCETDPGWLAGNLRPFGSCTGGMLVAYGVARQTATTVRFTFANAKPVTAQTIHARPASPEASISSNCRPAPLASARPRSARMAR